MQLTFRLLYLQDFHLRIRPDVNKLWNPSAFGYGNGRALAKLFGILANGGSFKGKNLMSPATVELQTQEVKSGRDRCLRIPVAYGRGYTIMTSPKVNKLLTVFWCLTFCSLGSAISPQMARSRDFKPMAFEK